MYLHNWKDDGFFGMIGDFEDIYITKAEYEAETAPYVNVEFWLDKKAKMKDALESDRWKGIDEVLLASYTYEDYSGDAFVLFRKGDKLYEVNGGHCSCYGLEGQWEPEDTNVEALRHRLEKGELGYEGWGEYKHNVFANELKQVFDKL